MHCIGTNDMLGSAAVGAIATNVRTAIININAAAGTKKPVHVIHWFGTLTGRPVDEHLETLLEIQNEFPGNVVLIDLGPFADTLGVNVTSGDPYELDSGDGIHLSAAGLRMWGELLARAVMAPPPMGVIGWSAAGSGSDVIAPVWPATLTTGAPTQTSVVVAASALATDAVGVTSYEVSIDDGSTWVAIAPSGLNFTLTGLTASTAYPAPRFRAADAAGNVSSILTARNLGAG